MGSSIKPRQTHQGPTRRSRRSVALIELLVILAVIVILIAVLLPALRSTRSDAQRIGGTGNQRQMSIAQLPYTASSGEVLTGPDLRPRPLPALIAAEPHELPARRHTDNGDSPSNETKGSQQHSATL